MSVGGGPEGGREDTFLAANGVWEARTLRGAGLCEGHRPQMGLTSAEAAGPTDPPGEGLCSAVRRHRVLRPGRARDLPAVLRTWKVDGLRGGGGKNLTSGQIWNLPGRAVPEA